ncbi:juvenile hormone esterase-like [Battus philenor]|uniref:juvenile hormone esterase-like n=1 Tax=Battus philenor TaxID=42288 RepID=UPI0035CEDA5A
MTCQELVTTAQGVVHGERREGYISYIGIPYASANRSRFKRAGLAPTWTGVREASDPHCTESSQVDKCLQLDVHVPSSDDTLYPVLVWVKSSSGSYHPGQLVRRGIIVVIVRHRMGPIGFLCTEEETIPGNAGIKDVVLALRWVRDNIVAFKGNPDKVVVAGESFGAAIVETIMLSSMSHGLFHGAVMQSGTVLSPWAFNYDTKSRMRALQELFNNKKVPDVFIEASIEDLVIKSERIEMPYMPFGICVEKSFKKEERVLTDAPYDMLSDGKAFHVPLIIGYNDNEAYVFANVLKAAEVSRRLHSDMSFLLPMELNGMSTRELKHTRDKIKEIYFKNNNYSVESLLRYHTDAYFINHIHRSALMHSSTSSYPVYYYQFSHSGDTGVEPESGMEKFGAAHTDELAYLFSENGRSLNGDDGKVQDILVTLWTNFVKHLNPTPHAADAVHWEALDHKAPRVLNIGLNTEMSDYPHSTGTDMWDEIYERYYTRQKTNFLI